MRSVHRSHGRSTWILECHLRARAEMSSMNVGWEGTSFYAYLDEHETNQLSLDAYHKREQALRVPIEELEDISARSYNSLKRHFRNASIQDLMALGNNWN